MKLTLTYLDTCLPDYFLGFSGPHTYAISLPRKPRNGEVLGELHRCIAGDELYLGDAGYAEPEHYQQMHQQAEEIFKDLDLRKSWSEGCDDMSESYAYFGVKVESDE